jgi:hypothetical protein
MAMRALYGCVSVATLAALLVLLPRLGESAPAVNKKASLPHFQTSDRCFACHNGMQAESGEDVSIGLDWRASMMANSARDPYWQGSVRRETMDHPESKAAIEDECSICHMPMARYEAKLNGREGQVFSHLPFDPKQPEDRLAADGVSCSLCHQISKEKLGTRESLVGGFVIDALKPKGEKSVYGPYKVDDGHVRIMRSSSSGFQPAESDHIRQSELCATCHTLITQALGPGGRVIGSLPEQTPYQEWLHSDFKDKQSCQSCHMPPIKNVAVTRVFGEKRDDGVARHVFVGANFFMQRMLNRYRGELSVWALPQELSTAADRTVDYLQNQAARIGVSNVSVTAGRLDAEVTVENRGGHKFPTGYPSRRTWLHFLVRDREGRVLFESGKLNPDGSIAGNDSDTDATRFEPHYGRISSPDQVQIYESIMADQAGVPTTGLLNAVRYVKDNRLLPRGFDKRTAGAEIATHGDAETDADFTGEGDRVHYSVSLGPAQGPYQVEAELWYQPTSYRWANNLKKYDAAEPRRFTGYWDAMAGSSAILVTRSAVTTAVSR